jgi:hypothetical protein
MSPYPLSRVLLEYRTTDKRIHRKQYPVLSILHNDWSVYLLLLFLLFFLLIEREIYISKNNIQYETIIEVLSLLHTQLRQT